MKRMLLGVLGLFVLVVGSIIVMPPRHIIDDIILVVIAICGALLLVYPSIRLRHGDGSLYSVLITAAIGLVVVLFAVVEGGVLKLQHASAMRVALPAALLALVIALGVLKKRGKTSVAAEPCNSPKREI